MTDRSKNDKATLDKKLDKALKDSFPDSDPVSTLQPDRFPLDESVNMAQLNFDLGIVHYASDTPYTQARTLGARGLSYRGMDSTYASAIAVARRILQREEVLLPQDQPQPPAQPQPH